MYNADAPINNRLFNEKKDVQLNDNEHNNKNTPRCNEIEIKRNRVPQNDGAIYNEQNKPQ